LETGPLNTTPHDNVLTIVAPKQGELEEALIAALREALNGAPPDWLSEGEACDISFGGPLETANTAISDVLDGAGMDSFAQKVEGRRKKFLIADMDFTIVTTETIDELAVFVGRGPEIAAITRRSMQGEMDFSEAIHERMAMLAGLEVSTFQETLAATDLSPGAETLVRTMTDHGAFTVMVTGGFENFSGPIAGRAGFNEHRANRFEIEDGRLTGRVIEPILGPDAKLDTLMTLAGEHGIPMSETLAIGDGANDVPMIRAAGLGIAYRGKPVTRDAVLDPQDGTSGACIDHADLTAALFFQGFRKSEFTNRPS